MPIQKKNRKWIVKISYIYIGILVFFSFVGDRGLWASYQLWMESKKLDQEIAKLQIEVQNLNDQVQKFRNDDKTIERYAREKMNLTGENEIQFIFK